jgi:hypothetical protein
MGDEKNTEHTKLQWHPAFLQAIQLELFDYRDSLEFKYEYQLASEPLRIDLLIIKKPKNIVINKNIAHIFRAENLLEYKSPEDYLSVNDYLKVYAYALLYAAIPPNVDLTDITLTFVESRHPRKLLQYLCAVRGYSAEETSPGIYLVSGDYIPIQIIESKKLSESENLWLKSLTNDLKVGNAGSILEERQKRGYEAPLDAYFDVLLRANPETFLEVQKMARRPTFEEVFTKAGIIPEWIERGKELGRKQGEEWGRKQGEEWGREQGREQGKKIIAQNLFKMGMPIEEIAQATELPVEKIRSLTSITTVN